MKQMLNEKIDEINIEYEIKETYLNKMINKLNNENEEFKLNIKTSNT